MKSARVLFTKFINFIHKRLGSNKTKTQTQSLIFRQISVPEQNPPIDESASFHPSLQASMSEIIAATKNFSADLILGDGGFGLVYKAVLPNGLNLAIKRLDTDAFQGFMEFQSELEILGKLRHRNTIRLLGCCFSGATKFLIYEFIERGSLANWLHGWSNPWLPLPWATRNKIVRGVANGLAYMHGLEKAIIHSDIKSSNVLLDSEFEARIVDFGVARMVDSLDSDISTQVAGTIAYMPPEYKEGFTTATVKGDVYSFGILMLEIAIGRSPSLPMVFDGVEMGLGEWARKMVTADREIEMVDVNITREGLVECNVKEYFRIACLCVNEVPRERPTMSNVLELLMQNST